MEMTRRQKPALGEVAGCSQQAKCPMAVRFVGMNRFGFIID